jgi:FkbH-like protein
MNSYLDLLKAKKALKESYQHNLDIVVLNNITTNPLKDYIEYQCSSRKIDARIEFGDYDNIAQNANDDSIDGKVVLVFWELANLIHGLEYKIESFTDIQIQELEERVKAEILFAFQGLEKAALVILNRFSALPFNYNRTQEGKLESLASRLNHFCIENSPKVFKWISIDKCLVAGGIEQSIDYKGFLKNKVLYKHAFYWHYSQLIQPYLNAVCGRINKLLALDCDNTLWKGILGEDGISGIEMDENTFRGQAFAAAQYQAMALGKKGVLLALASKNNQEDVNAVLKDHQAIIIKDDSLVAKKVNWDPKGQNLEALANELNIGVDSFVFVDDSDFEVQLMKDQLSEVTTLQVNPKGVEYYRDQFSWDNYFVQLNESKEDANKLEQYKQNVKRADEERKFKDFDGFLKALDLQLDIYINNEKLIPRMAQMTQKTNQFNLTTKRYTEGQIESMVNDPSFDCIAFNVKDKFGDSGVTGLCIVEFIDKEARIDSLLMSCRILGRKIEYRFMYEVLTSLFRKVEIIKGDFIPTKKNSQVSSFYEKVGFNQLAQNGDEKQYVLRKSDFDQNIDYEFIKVKYA